MRVFYVVYDFTGGGGRRGGTVGVFCVDGVAILRMIEQTQRGNRDRLKSEEENLTDCVLGFGYDGILEQFASSVRLTNGVQKRLECSH